MKNFFTAFVLCYFLLSSKALFSQNNDTENQTQITAPATENRQLRRYRSIEEPKLHFTTRIPSKPEWIYTIEKRKNTHAVIIQSPEKHVPPLALEIFTLHSKKIQQNQLLTNALSATRNIAKQINFKNTISIEDLKSASYGSISGYTYEFTVDYDNGKYDLLIFTGILGEGTPLSITASTTAGDMHKNMYYLDKIIGFIEPL